MLSNNVCPNKIRNSLMIKYEKNDDMLDFLPTIKQIRSRQQSLKKSTTDAGCQEIYEIRDISDLRTFINDKRISEDFNLLGIESNTQCLVLNSYDFEVKIEDQVTTCTGFTFTCKTFLQNIKKCVDCQISGMRLSWDGTYKLLRNGWTLILFGSISLKFGHGGLISHSFIPFSLTLTRSEAYPAFRSIMDAFVFSLKLLKIPIESINIQSLSQDHCFAAANGLDYLKNLFPNNKSIINLLDCETHVGRKIREKKNLLSTINSLSNILYLKLIIYR